MRPTAKKESKLAQGLQLEERATLVLDERQRDTGECCARDRF
jgi:hypothetical protein